MGAEAEREEGVRLGGGGHRLVVTRGRRARVGGARCSHARGHRGHARIGDVGATRWGPSTVPCGGG
jgi:hypothetical protein